MQDHPENAAVPGNPELMQQLAALRRELGVEKALETIRIKALEMQSSSELSETSRLLFQQLKELEIEALRTGVGIFDDENDAIELWVTSVNENGEFSFILDYINIHVHPVFENIMEARQQGKSYTITRLEGKKLIHYYETMSGSQAIQPGNQIPNLGIFYSFFFSAGTLNVVTQQELTAEELNIMLRMAQVFGLIYTRFLDLKKMEESNSALLKSMNDLRSAQAQLVQSEKMASLGELTAGIAHEIQNPLNFVNNFSELNKELISELRAAMESGNQEEAATILKNLEENEEKILFHGRRADGIVKGMLQHSRSSSGQKELTDINALADEYLRLAFHGLRAKDKSFNAAMKTDYDETIGLIKIIPQDLGRVILNLITNAFYAVTERKKKNEPGFEPVVAVSTKKHKENINITVKDNGPGIPRAIVDKIFQPFFTTKPTGQGTGLGLSLSYDIVKAHGGELKVETKEGDGSLFIISLPLNEPK